MLPCYIVKSWYEERGQCKHKGPLSIWDRISISHYWHWSSEHLCQWSYGM